MSTIFSSVSWQRDDPVPFEGARLGLPFGWQTCLIIMFPCGRLLCNSLDTHSGQLRAVWGQQESITINWPLGVKKRWSDDLTNDSCWLCLPEECLIKNSAEELHNTVTVPLSSSVRTRLWVLPSICYFLPMSSGPRLWICSSVVTRLSRLSCHRVVLSALSHEVSSSLGKRRDPLGKGQITTPPPSKLSNKATKSSHDPLTAPCCCLMSCWEIRRII